MQPPHGNWGSILRSQNVRFWSDIFDSRTSWQGELYILPYCGIKAAYIHDLLLALILAYKPTTLVCPSQALQAFVMCG